MAQMSRVFLRISFDGDGKGSVNRNAVAGILQGAGFQNPSTGMWETANSIPIAQATNALRAVCDRLDNLQPNNAGEAVSLDHMWIYLSGEQLDG